MPHTIGVVSGKGGVGKTTTAVNLACCLNQFNEDIILVDANVRNPNVSIHLNLPNIPVALQHVLNEGVNILHTIQIHHTGIRVVPSSIAFSHETNMSGLREAIKDLTGTAIIDSPPGMGEETRSVINSSDKVLVVSTPDVSSLTDSVKTIRTAKKMGKDVMGIILNRVKNDSFELTQDEIEIMCEVPVIGRIPEDDEVRKSTFESLPVVIYNPYAKATIEFNYITSKITNRPYEKPDMLFLRRLLRF